MEKVTPSKLNIKSALISSGLVLIIYLAVMLICRIAPFGDNTFLMFDLKRQYVDYYAYYSTVISGDNDIFYSFSTTLGAGMLGFFAYYMMSPFLILLSLFDKARLYLGVAIVIGLKLMLAAFIMNLFLQKFVAKVESKSLFDVSGLTVITGSVSWAFSGFLFAHSMNMMWMDVVILLPLIIYCHEELITENRKVPYIFVLTIMLILNYYITYQVLLYTAIRTIVRILVSRQDKPILTVFRTVISTATAAMISAVLLLPTFLELMNSPKDITKLGLKLTGKNLRFIDILSKFPTLAYDYIEARFGYPQIYCGVLLAALLLFYFLCRSISLKEKIGSFVMLAIMTVSLSRDLLNLIWHAGMEPSGHPYRQAYLLTFIVIVCASKGLKHLLEEITPLNAVLVLAVMWIGLYFIRRGRYDHFSNLSFIANAALLVVYTILFIALGFSKDKNSKPVTAIVSVLLLANLADLSANAIYTYHYQAMKCQAASVYRTMVADTKQAVDYIKAGDSSFYRMEDLSPRQQNDGLQYNYNGVTHYSSAGMIYVRYFLQRLGFNDDNLYTSYGHDNTATADSILGIKYVLAGADDHPHPGYDKVFSGNVNVYQNPNALSVAIGTNGFDYSTISGGVDAAPDSGLKHVPVMDAFSLQEDIYEKLLGRDVSIFKDAYTKKSDKYEKDDKFCYDYEVTASQDGELYMYFDGLIKAYESLSIYLNDEYLTTYGNAACTKIINLGYKNAGDTLKITMVGESENANFGVARFVTEDVAELRKLSSELLQKSCSISKISSSHLKISAGDYDGVFLSIPFEMGWHIKVDGKRVKAVAIYDSLTYVPIDNSNTSHTIEMRFVPKGIYVGLIITVLGLIIFVTICLYEKRGKV